VDYYDIAVDGAITAVTAAQIVNRCFAGTEFYCPAIEFDDTPFGITRVNTGPFNVNKLKTDGIDAEISWRQPVGSGNVAVRALGTYVFSLTTYDAGGDVTNRAGSLQSGMPSFNWRVDATYSTGPFEGTISANGFSSSLYDVTLVGPDSADYDPAAGNSINNNRFPAAAYLALSARYTIGLGNERTAQLFANVDNVLDKDPPIFVLAALPQGGNPYDLVGRRYRVGVRLTL
jgi:hypothetical protein